MLHVQSTRWAKIIYNSKQGETPLTVAPRREIEKTGIGAEHVPTRLEWRVARCVRLVVGILAAGPVLHLLDRLRLLRLVLALPVLALVLLRHCRGGRRERLGRRGLRRADLPRARKGGKRGRTHGKTRQRRSGAGNNAANNPPQEDAWSVGGEDEQLSGAHPGRGDVDVWRALDLRGHGAGGAEDVRDVEVGGGALAAGEHLGERAQDTKPREICVRIQEVRVCCVLVDFAREEA